jgi:hypothetical protein
LVVDPRGEVLAETAGPEEAMVVANLKADVLTTRRNTRMGFFLPHRRPELYGELVTKAAGEHIVTGGSAKPCQETPGALQNSH